MLKEYIYAKIEFPMFSSRVIVVGATSKLGVDLKWTPKKYVSKRDWTMCSKYANHSRFNNQHDCGDLYCMTT